MDNVLKLFSKRLATILVAGVLTLSLTPVFATTWLIGDNDGYGAAIPDNADHPFDLFTANYDGRSAAEVNATNGAQYTDTYSTTHPGYAPQDGTVATFTFTDLGDGWTQGSMWFDMADFQASRYGAVSASYNGIEQNWSFNDGAPHTNVRFFDLDQDVIDSINELGALSVVINRSNSGDFYGFDYAMLSDNLGIDTQLPAAVPVPAAIWLFGSGLLGFVLRSRKTKM